MRVMRPACRIARLTSMVTRRSAEEPAYVLHRYDWSESSLVLEVFTRNHGRIALVAKGVKRPTSQFRPVLLPLQALLLSWGGDAEVRTLKSAQWQGGHVMPTGEALISGVYLNELLMRLLARDDAHAALFDHYALTVQLLAERGDAQQLILRAFELLLLRDVGLVARSVARRQCADAAGAAGHGMWWTQNTACVWPRTETARRSLGEQWLCFASRPWMRRIRSLPLCGPVRRLRPRCVRSCGACCTTIVGFAASRRAS